MSFYYNFYFLSSEVYTILSISILIIFGVYYTTNKMAGYPIVFQNLAWLVIQILSYNILLVYLQNPNSVFLWNNFFVKIDIIRLSFIACHLRIS